MKSFLKNIIVWILQAEALLVIRKYRPKIVAITGSVGKTSTKDAIFTVLSNFFFVRKSEKSFNSEIGVPLTILGLPNGWDSPFIWAKNIVRGLALILLPNHYPKWLVLEIGADRPGDIKKITTWIIPDIAVLTTLGRVPVHVEFFPSIESLIEEKSNLAKALTSNGVLVLNSDDENTLSLRDLVYTKPICYGFGENAAIRSTHYAIWYDEVDGKPRGINFKVGWENSIVPIHLSGVVGVQHVYPILAALAVAVSQGLNMVLASGALENFSPPRGRMNLLEGKNSSLIIDDSYNSSPIAAEEALKTLGEIRATRGRKIAVLGDMMELGRYSSEEHRKLGSKVSEVCEALVTVGIRARFIAEGALKKKMAKRSIYIFDTTEEAAEFLKDFVQADDIILVKGSQSVRLERAVLGIMAHPERRKEFLIRQEDEWQRR